MGIHDVLRYLRRAKFSHAEAGPFGPASAVNKAILQQDFANEVVAGTS